MSSSSSDRAALLARIRAALRSQVGTAGDDADIDLDTLNISGASGFGEVAQSTVDALASRLGGDAGDGSPLNDLFSSFPDDAAQRAGLSLLSGLTQGPIAIAQNLAQVLSISQNRAETIARNELIGSYRDAQMANYRANSDVVGSWMWSAAIASACIMCVEMDGTIHNMDEDLMDHVCGRCAPLPITRSWDDILSPYGLSADGIPETSITESYGSGHDWFMSQDAATQASIMGPAKYEAWRSGDISLNDLVGVREDGAWGNSLYERSLKEMGLDAQDYLPYRVPRETGLGPQGAEAIENARAAIPEPELVRVDLGNGMYTYVDPFEPLAAAPNMAGRDTGWQNIDDALAGLRSETTQALETAEAGTTEAEAAGALDMTTNPDVKFISEQDVAAWTANNAEDVPDIGIHNSTPEGYQQIMRDGVDVMKSDYPVYGAGFYMYDAEHVGGYAVGPFASQADRTEQLQLAVHMDNPYVLNTWEGGMTRLANDMYTAHPDWRDAAPIIAPDGTKIAAMQYQISEYLRERGYDGIIVTIGDANKAKYPGRYYDEIIAIKPGTVRIINDEQAAAAELRGKAFSAMREVTGGEAVSNAATYTLTDEDKAFVQTLQDQIPDGGIATHDDAIALGQQVHERINDDLGDLPNWTQEAADIRTRAPNLTDAERAWVSGDKDAIAAHGGVKFYDVNKAYQDAYQARARAYLAEVRDVGGGALKVSSDPGVDSYVAEQLENASKLLPADWVQASNDFGEIIPLRERSADAADGWFKPDASSRSGNAFIALRYNKQYSDAYVESSALHELMHRMESVVPDLSKMQEAYYESRTAGEAFVDLTNGIDQKTKLDKWLDQYLGREPVPTYTRLPQRTANGSFTLQTNSYELLTLGAEMLFAPGVDASTFALINDPEFVQFVLGAFLGVKP